MNVKAGLALLFGVLACLGLWAYDHQAAQLKRTTAINSLLAAKVAEQADALEAWQRRDARLVKLETSQRATDQLLQRQHRETQKAFEDLKANDKATADWLRGAVPAALGRLYQRAETTDPTAWRVVPPGGVPAAGSRGAGQQ